MRKFLLFCLLLCCGMSAQAQLFSNDKIKHRPNMDEQKWSWGYFVGLNTFDLDVDYKYLPEQALWQRDVKVDKTFGFNVGLIGDMRINNNLNLRLEPGVVFNRYTIQTITGEDDAIHEVTPTYIHIPLLLKYSTNRLNNFKPFIVGGLSTSVNLASNQDNPDIYQFRMKTYTYYYEIGFGIDFYLEYFKFSPSIRGVFAINDELVEGTIHTEHIEKISSRGIFLNLTFQ